MSSTIRNIQTHEELKALINQDRPVVVDFWAPWCGPCKAFSPILEDVATALGDQAIVVKVNVDDAPELARDYRIASIPTVVYFADGSAQHEARGIQSQPEIMGRVESYIAQKSA